MGWETRVECSGFVQVRAFPVPATPSCVEPGNKSQQKRTTIGVTSR